MLLIHALGKSALCLVLKHHLSLHSPISLPKWLEAFIGIFIYHYYNVKDTKRSQDSGHKCHSSDSEHPSESQHQPWAACISSLFETEGLPSPGPFLECRVITWCSGWLPPPCSGTFVLVSSSIWVNSSFHVPESVLLFVKWYSRYRVYPMHVWRQPGLTIRAIDFPTHLQVSLTLKPLHDVASVISLNLLLKSLNSVL